MFRKVAAKERIVGFYSSGPKIRGNDLAIESLMRKFCPSPVFVIIDVRPNQQEIPTTAYKAVEEVEGDGKEIQRTFQHLPSSIEAMEAEEVGVEHLLRDINDPTTSTIANQVKSKILALGSLSEKVRSGGKGGRRGEGQ
jgi:26S proteasome regulatory subunit N8